MHACMQAVARGGKKITTARRCEKLCRRRIENKTPPGVRRI